MAFDMNLRKGYIIAVRFFWEIVDLLVYPDELGSSKSELQIN